MAIFCQVLVIGREEGEGSRPKNLENPEKNSGKSQERKISFPVLPFLVSLKFIVFSPCEDFLVFLLARSPSLPGISGVR